MAKPFTHPEEKRRGPDRGAQSRAGNVTSRPMMRRRFYRAVDGRRAKAMKNPKQDTQVPFFVFLSPTCFIPRSFGRALGGTLDLRRLHPYRHNIVKYL